jgi:flavin reductase (DIM6/NTAB) family NADH-FMN oxidoreductase RutF
VGFLALSFAHVSASPPTVLVPVSRTTTALKAILESRIFAANVLAKGGQALAQAFGGKSDMTSRFALGEWEQFVTGAPVLRQAACVFDCVLKQSVEEEGAVILVAAVVGMRLTKGLGATVAYENEFRDFEVD